MKMKANNFRQRERERERERKKKMDEEVKLTMQNVLTMVQNNTYI